MEEKYGTKMGEAKPLIIANSGLLMLSLVLLVAGIAVLAYSLSKGGFNAVCIPLILVGGVLLAYVVKILQGGVFCYEEASVIKEPFREVVIPRKDIGAIFWDRPGANASNAKVRTNVNVADIIMAGGRKHYKISDGAYSNVEVLGLYQDHFKIPMEIVR